MNQRMPMPVFQAIGIVIFVIALKLLVPPVFAAMESTALAFLHGAEVSANAASQIAGAAASIPNSIR